MRHIATYQDWRRIQESQAYIENGTINEGWISDWLHTAADFVSIAADIIVPGTGAVVDIIQAISYFLEGLTEEDTSAGASSILSGLVTIGSLALAGPMQLLATKMKGSISSVRDGIVKGASPTAITAARKASVDVVKFLKDAITDIIPISNKISSLVTNAAESKLGNWIISKFGSTPKFITWIKDTFTKKIPGILKSFADSLAKLNPALKGTVGSVDDLTIKAYAKDYTEGKVKDKIKDKAKEILSSGVQEVLKSGIPRTQSWVEKYVPDQVRYQRDTSDDFVVKPPINIKKKVGS